MKQRLSGRAFGAVLIVLLLNGFAAAVALADSTPPPATTVVVTVTNPVTAPPPDPAPHPTPTPAPKAHHPRVTPKPPAAPPVVQTTPPTAGSVGGVQPASSPTTAPHTRTPAHPRVHKKTAAAQKKHKAKTGAKQPKHKPTTTQPAAPAPGASLPTRPRKITAPPAAAVHNGGGNGLVLTLFAIVAFMLLAAAAVFGVRRRRSVRAAAWEFGSTTAEAAPVLAPVFAPLSPRVGETEPVAADIVAGEAIEEAEDIETEALDGAPIGNGHCEVTAWRGYAKWRFYARIDTGAGEVALIESRPFRAPGSAAPDATAAAEAAYTELIARLEAEGWQRVDGGDRWFESAFVRRDAEDPAGSTPEAFASTEVLERDVVT